MRDRVLAWLADNVPESRLRHILGVEQLSIDLARHYQLDANKAGMAGLMHDLAKCFKGARLCKMARKAGIVIDPVCDRHPHLLHADVSALVAREEFGIEDEDILAAIRNHTLGQPQMSQLSCVVFVADALEPSRGKSEKLAEMRQACWQNLYQSVWQTSDYSLHYLLTSQRIIHPRTVLTRNWAMEQYRQTLRKAD